MKKQLKAIVVLGLLGCVLQSTSAFAQGYRVNLGSTENCVIPKIDGERVPFPLQKANSKFELAEGETYLINGTLVFLSGQVFLKVDFNTQPWLATSKLVQNPYFPVSSVNPGAVRRYNGRVVQMAVLAQHDTDGSSANGLKLASIMPPMGIQ